MVRRFPSGRRSVATRDCTVAIGCLRGPSRSADPARYGSLFAHPRLGSSPLSTIGDHWRIVPGLPQSTASPLRSGRYRRECALGSGMTRTLGPSRAHCTVPAGDDRLRRKPRQIVRPVFHSQARWLVSSITPSSVWRDGQARLPTISARCRAIGQARSPVLDSTLYVAPSGRRVERNDAPASMPSIVIWPGGWSSHIPIP